MGCGIFGAVRTHKTAEFEAVVEATWDATGERGRDLQERLRDGCREIGLCRGTPTTEAIEGGGIPTAEGWSAVLNGTIANDAWLGRQLLIPRPAVDTALLPVLFARRGFRAGVKMLAPGSFAILAIPPPGDVDLFFACDYRPLWIRVLDGGVVVAQAESYLEQWPDPQQWAERCIRPVPPWSIGYVAGRKVRFESFRDPAPSSPVLVVCSGGLDSVAAAALLVAEKREVRLLHVLYGCHAESREATAVERVSEALGLQPPILVHASYWQSGALIDPAVDVADGVDGVERSREWVAARNLNLCAIALAVAEERGYGTVALGVNMEEAGAFPDNELEFVNRLNGLMQFAVSVESRIAFEAPVGHLMKHEIVARGLAAGAPFEHSWSCYRGGEKHCQRCGPCTMRRIAFQRCGVEDPAR